MRRRQTYAKRLRLFLLACAPRSRARTATAASIQLGMGFTSSVAAAISDRSAAQMTASQILSVQTKCHRDLDVSGGCERFAPVRTGPGLALAVEAPERSATR